MAKSAGGARRGKRAGARRPAAAKRAGRSGSRQVAQVCAALERLAPLRLAAEWDNVGLLAGSRAWPAAKALLAIDLTDAVAQEALAERADVVVAYHPPIFKGIRRVTAEAEAPTGLLAELLAARTSVYALHTALDAAVGGTNDVLLDAFELRSRHPLEPLIAREESYKLVVFVPPREADALRQALSAAGAGVIGNYSECSFELHGRGTFRGDESTNPTIGERGRLETAEELRLEMVVPRGRLAAVVRALYAEHSYEEPAFDLYPVHAMPERGRVGMGRVGELRRPATGEALLARLAGRVDLRAAQVVGDLRRRFERVTAAAGSFGPRAFRDPHSLVLTGELKHHEALELLRRGVTAVCLGHYASERPVLDVVAEQLRRCVRGLRVMISRADAAPLRALGAGDDKRVRR